MTTVQLFRNPSTAVDRRPVTDNLASVREFLDFCTSSTEDESVQASADSMTGVYLTWCDNRRVEPLSDQQFYAVLRELGLRKIRQKDSHLYKGVRLTGPVVKDYILQSPW